MEGINTAYPASCALEGEGRKKLNKQGVRQRIGHHRSVALKMTTEGTHPEQLGFF